MVVFVQNPQVEVVWLCSVWTQVKSNLLENSLEGVLKDNERGSCGSDHIQGIESARYFVDDYQETELEQRSRTFDVSVGNQIEAEGKKSDENPAESSTYRYESIKDVHFLISAQNILGVFLCETALMEQIVDQVCLIMINESFLQQLVQVLLRELYVWNHGLIKQDSLNFS